jgi:hypothetical protein
MASKSFILTTQDNTQAATNGRTSITVTTNIGETTTDPVTGTNVARQTGYPYQGAGSPSEYAIINNSTNKYIAINKISFIPKRTLDSAGDASFYPGSAASQKKFVVKRLSAYTSLHVNGEYSICSLDSSLLGSAPRITLVPSASSVTGSGDIKSFVPLKICSGQNLMISSLVSRTNTNSHYGKIGSAKKANHSSIVSYSNNLAVTGIVLNTGEIIGVTSNTNLAFNTATSYVFTIIYDGNTYIVKSNPNWKYGTTTAEVVFQNDEATPITIIDITMECISTGDTYSGGASVVTLQLQAFTFYNIYQNYSNRIENQLTSGGINLSSFEVSPLSMDTANTLDTNIKIYKGLIPACRDLFIDNRQINAQVPLNFPIHRPNQSLVLAGSAKSFQAEFAKSFIKYNTLDYTKNPLIVNPNEIFILGSSSATLYETYPLEVKIEFTEEDIVVAGGNTEIAYGY